MILAQKANKLVPLFFDSKEYKGPAITNPSIFNKDGQLYVLLRNVNYTLYHAERGKNPHEWGPLIYIHREDDVKLRTWNWFGKLDKDYNLADVFPIDTSLHDKEPLWEFIGLEDARIISISDDHESMEICGVRRDTTTNGQGRMEISTIRKEDDKFVETGRRRIEPPQPSSYCEKNWVPILSEPRTFVKWSNPVEIVRIANLEDRANTIAISDKPYDLQWDWRGSSQVIDWDEDHHIYLIHETHFAFNKANKKDATYRHRFLMMSKETYEIVNYSKDFSFMNGRIEFCCGMARKGNKFLVTFGFQDNTAFLLELDRGTIEETFHE